MELPKDSDMPPWKDVAPERNQVAFSRGLPRGRKDVQQWGGTKSSLVQHFLFQVLADSGLSDDDKKQAAVQLMKDIWDSIREYDRSAQSDNERILLRTHHDAFRLNPRWLRIRLVEPSELLECDTCASLSIHDIRGICPRNSCSGKLVKADKKCLSKNHYRILYNTPEFPPIMCVEEHTAQINSELAREFQDRFKRGDIHLLSSSTTFEVGMDLGDLEVVFLRNVPPEPFNYTQRVGRAGRRENPGLALTYCRRRPHDLYHYENPEASIIAGKAQPPRLQMTNKKIISRHMTAVALSAFFKQAGNKERCKNVATFIGDFESPQAVVDLRRFCETDKSLKYALLSIVPQEMHYKTHLSNDVWIDDIAGPDSLLALAEAEVCGDHQKLG